MPKGVFQMNEQKPCQHYLPSLLSEKEIAKATRQQTESLYNDNQGKQLLNDAIQLISDHVPSSDYGWFTIDEVADVNSVADGDGLPFLLALWYLWNEGVVELKYGNPDPYVVAIKCDAYRHPFRMRQQGLW
jgi:hypothetical protein